MHIIGLEKIQSLIDLGIMDEEEYNLYIWAVSQGYIDPLVARKQIRSYFETCKL